MHESHQSLGRVGQAFRQQDHHDWSIVAPACPGSPTTPMVVSVNSSCGECGATDHGKSSGSDHAGESVDSSAPSNLIETVVPDGPSKSDRSILLL